MTQRYRVSTHLTLLPRSRPCRKCATIWLYGRDSLAAKLTNTLSQSSCPKQSLGTRTRPTNHYLISQTLLPLFLLLIFEFSKVLLATLEVNLAFLRDRIFGSVVITLLSETKLISSGIAYLTWFIRATFKQTKPSLPRVMCFYLIRLYADCLCPMSDKAHLYRCRNQGYLCKSYEGRETEGNNALPIVLVAGVDSVEKCLSDPKRCMKCKSGKTKRRDYTFQQ